MFGINGFRTVVQQLQRKEVYLIRKDKHEYEMGTLDRLGYHRILQVRRFL